MNSLAGTADDTGIAPGSLVPLITYWEQTRGLYRPFESDMRSSSTDVYLHEMPGALRASSDPWLGCAIWRWPAYSCVGSSLVHNSLMNADL